MVVRRGSHTRHTTSRGEAPFSTIADVLLYDCGMEHSSFLDKRARTALRPLFRGWRRVIRQSLPVWFEFSSVPSATSKPIRSITGRHTHSSVTRSSAPMRVRLYVGLSRCGDGDRVTVFTIVDRVNSRLLWNVVYPEALKLNQRR